MGKFRDLTGRTFGKWKVIQRVSNKNKQTTYRVRCQCGAIQEVYANHLFHGRSTCCLNCHAHNRKGYGEISGDKWCHYRKSANVRGIPFDISIEDAWAIFVNQQSKCKLSGVPISFGAKATASLDRIDSKLGYTRLNVQWLHKDVNVMKGIQLDAEFVRWCQIIAENNLF